MESLLFYAACLAWLAVCGVAIALFRSIRRDLAYRSPNAPSIDEMARRFGMRRVGDKWIAL